MGTWIEPYIKSVYDDTAFMQLVCRRLQEIGCPIAGGGSGVSGYSGYSGSGQSGYSGYSGQDGTAGSGGYTDLFMLMGG